MSTDASSITESPQKPQAARARLFLWALLSAALTRAAFAPLDWGWIAWLGLAPLFHALPLARRPRSAFALGYLFGIVSWGWTITWIGTTVSNWTGSSVGWVAWVLLTLIKSLWFGLFGWLAWWIGRRTDGAIRPLTVAAAWTLVEWMRGQTAIAMPWALIGYTQHAYLPLIQAADLGGVYLISFVVAWTNASLVQMAVESSNRARYRALMPAASAVVAILVYGLAAGGRRYKGPEVRIALMQPNVRSDRTAAGADERDLEQFRILNRRAAASRPLAVIWPESIAPQDVVNDPPTRLAFAKMARESGAWTLAGTGYEDKQGRPYNSAALFAPDGHLAARYDKQWLVPMGEWIVGRSWLPFGGVFHFPKYDVVAGTSDQPLAAGPARMAVLICYETVFPIMPRNRVNHGANLLVSITNDSWAGESSELAQHFAMTRFRAVETRRYMAASATTGITAMVDPLGRVREIPPYRPDLLIANAKLLDGRTPYVIFGDWVALASAALILYALRRPRMAAAD